MKTIVVNAVGDRCPIPVVKTLKAMSALTEPSVIEVLVDDVIPGRDSSKLVTVLVALLGIYILQYVMNGLRSYKLRLAGDRITLNLKKDIYEKAQYNKKNFGNFI